MWWYIRCLTIWASKQELFSSGTKLLIKLDAEFYTYIKNFWFCVPKEMPHFFWMQLFSFSELARSLIYGKIVWGFLCNEMRINFVYSKEQANKKKVYAASCDIWITIFTKLS